MTTDISAADITELMTARDDVVFIDVRESEEFSQGHIPGAVAAPLGTLEHAVDRDSIARNDALIAARDAIAVVYCDNGERSRTAAEQLEDYGYRRVHRLVEGLKGWQSSGLPLIT
jgi:rhodanese-related sulfurtransferase